MTEQVKDDSSPIIITGITGAFILIGTFFACPHLSPEQSQWSRVQGVITDRWYDYDGTRHDVPTSGKGDAERERIIQFDYTVDGVKHTREENYSGHIGDAVFLRCPPGQPDKAILEPNPYQLQLALLGYAMGGVSLSFALIVALIKATTGKTPDWAIFSKTPQGK